MLEVTEIHVCHFPLCINRVCFYTNMQTNNEQWCDLNDCIDHVHALFCLIREKLAWLPQAHLTLP